MITDRETRTRIAAMTAAEAAMELKPQDPFEFLEVTSAEAADSLSVEVREVHDLAEEIVVEILVETHLTPSAGITTFRALVTG